MMRCSIISAPEQSSAQTRSVFNLQSLLILKDVRANTNILYQNIETSVQNDISLYPFLLRLNFIVFIKQFYIKFKIIFIKTRYQDRLGYVQETLQRIKNFKIYLSDHFIFNHLKYRMQQVGHGGGISHENKNKDKNIDINYFYTHTKK